MSALEAIQNLLSEYEDIVKGKELTSRQLRVWNNKLYMGLLIAQNELSDKGENIDN